MYIIRVGKDHVTYDRSIATPEAISGYKSRSQRAVQPSVSDDS